MTLSIPLLIENMLSISSFFSVIVGLFAVYLMITVARKFGTGIVADGFRYVTIGVIFIVAATLFESFIRFYEIRAELVRFTREVLLIIGTYAIVIGAKITADKLEDIHK